VVILHVEVDVMVRGVCINNDPPFFGELYRAQMEGIDLSVGIYAPNFGAISASTPC